MAKQPFKARGGFDDGSRVIISGVGIPGGDAGIQDGAPVGSEYTNNTTGDKYVKRVAGAGTANWETLVRSSELAQLAGGAWREPALVLDNTSTTTAAVVAAMNVGDSLDGITVAAGSRVLLTGLTALANVYIVGGSTGAWSLVEDANTATAGDVIRVVQGTYAGQAWQFRALGIWQFVDAQTNAEDQFVRAFIGKAAAGSALPAYTSNNVVANNDALEVAIGKLDSKAGTDSSRISSVESINTTQQSEIDSIEAGAGLDVGGAYTAPTGTTHLTPATSLKNADVILDSAIAQVAADLITEANNRTLADGNLQTEVDAIETGAGLGVNGAYTPTGGSNYIAGATSLDNADQLLDAQIALNNANIAQESIDRGLADTAIDNKIGNQAYSSTNVIATNDSSTTALGKLDAQVSSIAKDSVAAGFTTVVIDSFLVDSLKFVEWSILMEDSANASNCVGVKLSAMHNGTPTADATQVDETDYAELDLGTDINADFQVQLSGTGASQIVQLILTAPASVNARVRRSGI